MTAYVGTSKWLQAFLISTTDAREGSVFPPCGKGSQVPTGYNSSAHEMLCSGLSVNPQLCTVPHAYVSVCILYRLLDDRSVNPHSSVSTAPSLRPDDRNLLTLCRISIDFRSVDQIPVEARFSAPVQTGPVARPTSYTMGTGSFPGLKRPGHGIDHPPLSSAEAKERVELYLYSPSGPSWPVLG
jgi:hypothetical protein